MDRQKQFEAFDFDSHRKRRESNMTELRKAHRTDDFYKRRNLTECKAWVDVNSHFKPCYTLEDLPTLLEASKSTEDFDLLLAAQGFRKLLSASKDSPIQKVIDLGLVSQLLAWVQRSDFPQLQYEAGWILTNIASGESKHVQVIIEKGGVVALTVMLRSEVSEVLEQGVWALGNIGGDSSLSRDLVLQNDGMKHMVAAALSNKKLSTVKLAIWGVSNLCRGRPPPKYNLVKAGIPALARGLTLNDNDLIADVCWAFAQLTDIQEDGYQDIVNAGVIPTIITIAQNDYQKTQYPAIKFIGNMICGHDLCAQIMVENEATKAIAACIESKNKRIRKEAVWTVSNLCAGTVEHVGYVIEQGILSRVMQISLFEGTEIQIEAIWAIANALKKGNLQQADFMIEQNVITILQYFLGNLDNKIICTALNAFKNLLKKDRLNRSGGESYLSLLERLGVIDQIEKLQEHQSNEVYKNAIYILEKFCNVAEPPDSLDLIQTIKASFNF